MAAVKIALLTLGAAASVVAGTSDNLRSCLENALPDSDSVAFPNDPFYQQEVNRLNLNIPITPAALTWPHSSQQIAAIVKCAADNDYPVQARSGGHSYGNYGEPDEGVLLKESE